MTKILEEGEYGQTPEVIVSTSIQALEGGEELIATTSPLEFPGVLC